MAGTKISALTAGAALGGTEALPAVQTAATVKITADQIKTFTSASPTLVTPVLGVAAGTSLALGGATIGSNALAVTGTANISGLLTVQGSGGIASPGGLSITNFVDIGYNTTTGISLGSAKAVAWNSATNPISAANNDTGLSRISAGVIGVGTGAQGSIAGKLQASEYRLTNSEAIYPRTTNSITMYVGADIAEFIAAGTASGMQFGSTRALNWSSGAVGATSDLFLSRPAAATLQHGTADAASPVAQTIKFQDVVAGTSNTAGVNATIRAPAGTGTGAGGSLIFQVAPAGSSGTAKNAWATALTIDSTKTVTFAGAAILPQTSYLFWSGRGVLRSPADGSLQVLNNAETQSFTITAGASNLATFNGGITLGGPLKVSNAYVATPQVPTGYITIYDSTGTAYKVSVNV